MSCPGCRRLEWGEMGGRVLKDSASIKVGTRANTWASNVQRSRPARWHRTCPVRPEVCGIISWACSPTHLTLRQPCRPSHPSPRQAAHSLGINRGRGSTHISSHSERLNLKAGRALTLHVCSAASAVSNSVQPHGPYQAPPSMGFSRQEYRSGLLCPPAGDLLDPGNEPCDSCTGRLILYPLSQQGSL